MDQALSPFDCCWEVCMRGNIFIAMLVSCLLSVSSAADFFVSPEGRDDNPGTRRKPFLTLDRARSAVHKVKSEYRDQQITVWLREGLYAVEQTVEFMPEDSGTEKAPVTYSAYPGEKVVVSGGRSIAGSQK